MFKFGFSSEDICEPEIPVPKIEQLEYSSKQNVYLKSDRKSKDTLLNVTVKILFYSITSVYSNKYVVEWVESKEISPKDVNISEMMEEIPEDAIIKCTYKNVSVRYINSQIIIDRISKTQSEGTNSVLIAEKNHSDLIKGVYEGGLKVWECTHDLCNYIVTSRLELNGKQILDLGCGAGIIGILCHLQRSISYFQDYNEDVIKNFTIPNLRLNLNDMDLESVKCKFYSGDWSSFVNLMNFVSEEDKFDFIFTSETIYNTENYNKLHMVFEKCLKKNGKIFVAALSYYFGVGGGTSQFKNILEKKGVFDYTTCWEFTKGMRREILELVFKT